MFDLPSSSTMSAASALDGEQPGPDDWNADWSTMLLAIRDKLKSCVGNPQDIGRMPQLGDASERTRSGVLECARALDQVHGLLKAQLESHELARAQAAEFGRADDGDERSSDGLSFTPAGAGDRQLCVCHLQPDTRAGLSGIKPSSADGRALGRLLPNGQLGALRAPAVAASFEDDGVTWLAGEHFFLDRVDQMLLRSGNTDEQIAVLLIQIEGMQSIREQHGHVVAKHVLTNALARLINRIPSRDLTCRLSERQFACLLTNWQSRDALDGLLARLLSAVNADYASGELKLRLHTTVGVAVTPSAGKSARAMLESARTALALATNSPSGFALFKSNAMQLSQA